MQSPQAEDSSLALSVAWKHGQTEGENTSDAKRRRMPWVAKITREDPFRPEDSNELYAQCKRIAAAS
jgi:hypothetical protein